MTKKVVGVFAFYWNALPRFHLLDDVYVIIFAKDEWDILPPGEDQSVSEELGTVHPFACLRPGENYDAILTENKVSIHLLFDNCNPQQQLG
jgi:hypothetical protein